MRDREPGTSLVAYGGGASKGVLVPSGAGVQPRLDESVPVSRLRDRRRSGRLPDRLLRGLLLDRLV